MTSVLTMPADTIALVRDTLRAERGFTYDPAAGALVRIGDRDGWVVSRPGTERTLTPAELDDDTAVDRAAASALREATETGGMLGGWYSPGRHLYMFEVSDIYPVDRDTAAVLGIAADQESVMDMRTGETVWLAMAEQP